MATGKHPAPHPLRFLEKTKIEKKEGILVYQILTPNLKLFASVSIWRHNSRAVCKNIFKH
jgi:hypothetical protein